VFQASNVARFADYQKYGDFDYDEDEDAITIPQPDGGVIIQFGPSANDNNPGDDDDFYGNLADQIDSGTLGFLSHEILDGIKADDDSRTQWIADRTRGLDLLAIRLDQPRADLGGSGAPMDGMSTVRHPLLLEACIKFQSNFNREMLPEEGPVKIKNEGNGTSAGDAQAEKLGDLLNRYFTEFAPEYYPDTDRMAFDLGFSGMGFKKPFHCPIRRRPVSDTVQAKDLIVSNEATDLRSAQRVTHMITMTRALFKRMQFVGAYRNVHIGHPDNVPVDPLTQKQKQTQGIAPNNYRPQDQTYTIYECYTWADIPGFEHVDEDNEPTGLQLPYKITIEKTSRQILEVRRNWDPEADDNFEPIANFIAYSFVPMFGFYATGLLHILGNTTAAVTGAWRILLDAGMFSNFPGFLYAKTGSRQDNLNFRVPPGGGCGVDIGGGDDIRQSIMAIPYKGPDTATMQLTDSIAATGQRVGGSAEMISTDGIRQNMPVGTTMALIEQASITLSAVHKRQCVSQGQELRRMLDLFRERPDGLWRFIAKDGSWTYQELIQTLNTYTLVPVADPNTPTHVHRIMKMQTLKGLQAATPDIYDARKVDAAVLRAMKFTDPEEFFVPPAPPGAAPPDPAIVIAQMTIQQKQMDMQAKLQIEQQKGELARQKMQLDAAMKQLAVMAQGRTAHTTNKTKLLDMSLKAETSDLDRQSKEQIEHMKLAHSTVMSVADGERAMQGEREARAHVSHEAGLDRAHTSQESGADREHKTGLERTKLGAQAQMAADDREAAGDEAAAARAHEASQATADRRLTATESHKARSHEAGQKDADRKNAAGENDKNRQNAVKLAAMKPKPAAGGKSAKPKGHKRR
jgi:hypothetical protein